MSMLRLRCLLREHYRVFFGREQKVGPWSRKPEDKELGEKLRILQTVPGPRDCWRAMGDETACVGKTPSAKACIDMHVPGSAFDCGSTVSRCGLQKTPGSWCWMTNPRRRKLWGLGR